MAEPEQQILEISRITVQIEKFSRFFNEIETPTKSEIEPFSQENQRKPPIFTQDRDLGYNIITATSTPDTETS
ncbi:hypothetical protein AYI69_g7647 [Smittium culicis]|uniref:Uncharacterized protein n=1 Tax=Smittium culicis TaxID=133412 RepID=A0A1R1XQP2_9FUNG|nr:hypothetical protein AYI69_g7647 [Smittium culicis]